MKFYGELVVYAYIILYPHPQRWILFGSKSHQLIVGIPGSFISIRSCLDDDEHGRIHHGATTYLPLMLYPYMIPAINSPQQKHFCKLLRIAIF